MNASAMEPSLPSSWYRSEAIFKIEKERLFCREWICVGREEELPEAGDHLVLDVLGESILLLRDRDRRLAAFYNVCRHRGARLCPAAGSVDRWGAPLGGGVSAGRIVCPYHQWSYDFSGALVAAPHLGGAADFDKKDFHLYPVAVDTWGGFIFLHLTPAESTPLGAQLAPIAERVRRYPLADLRIGATRRYAVDANWKILCENYNECYHCAGVHPELCAVVPAFREGGGANLDWEPRCAPSGGRVHVHAQRHGAAARLSGSRRGRTRAPQGRARVSQSVRESRLRARGGIHFAAALGRADRGALPLSVRAV